MTRIIGGMFGLEESIAARAKPEQPPFLEPGSLLLVNARSGIHVVVEELKPRRVWMPSYLCGTMLAGVRGVPLRFYPVDRDLSIAAFEGLGEGDLLVVIDYFGFPAPAWLFEYAKSRGASLLEDACQALLTEGVGQRSDFVLFSPRKFLGVPDGGILISHAGFASHTIKLAGAPRSWTLKAFEAVVLRREFDLYGGDRRWFTLFRELEEECPVGYLAMSAVTELLLHAFDYEAIARRRRENYTRLAQRLAHIALFPELLAGVVPLGFPVRLKTRDAVRQRLFDAQIYPPVHWPIAGIVPEEFAGSHRLNKKIMTLPCDQRYTVSDMDRIADIVLQSIAAPDENEPIPHIECR